MSEFQFSLLIIGLVVVVGVYGYGLWQQWRLRRVQDQPVSPSSKEGVNRPVTTEPLVDLVTEPVPEERAETADEVCGLLSDTTDFMAVFLLKNHQSPAALESLWQRRFDFDKNVFACGLNHASGLWERVIPESGQSYRAFRIGLQLVDRSGWISEMRLVAFSELLAQIAKQLQVEVKLPSVQEALVRAVDLDRFCAEVDQMIGINLMTTGDRKLFGTEVAHAAEQLGMSLQSDGTFQLLDAQGYTLFTLGASDNSPFQSLTLNQTRVDSLTLLLDLPRVTQPARRFDEMIALGQELAKALRTTMVDDQRVALNEGSIAQIRSQVAALEEHMLAGHITPGSPQALRLFS